jgi:hypothetical protein
VREIKTTVGLLNGVIDEIISKIIVSFKTVVDGA